MGLGSGRRVVEAGRLHWGGARGSVVQKPDGGFGEAGQEGAWLVCTGSALRTVGGMQNGGWDVLEGGPLGVGLEWLGSERAGEWAVPEEEALGSAMVEPQRSASREGKDG